MSSTARVSGDRPRRPPAWLWGAIAVGLALRVAAVLHTPVFPTVANTWDSNFYDRTARALAGGQGYTFKGKPTAFYPPGYPALLGLAYGATAPGPRTGQAVNVAASLVLLGAGAWLAGQIAGPRAARFTAAALALDPSQIVMPAFLMSEVVCAASLALTVAVLVRYARRGGWGWLALAAVLGAYAGMVRGHAFLLPPLVALALWKRPRFGPRRVLATLAVLAAADLAVLGFWAARNDRLLGKPVPIATNGGINLLLGNNPHALGGRADPPGGVPQTGDEVRDEEIAAARARAYIAAHPARFLALLPVKAARLWIPAPAATYRAELAAKWGRIPAAAVVILAELVHLAALVLAGAGLRRSWRARSRPEGAPVLRVDGTGLLAWTLGHLPFLGGARYFFPVTPFLWGAAATGLPGKRPPRPPREPTGSGA